jgi:hypothetical protein
MFSKTPALHLMAAVPFVAHAVSAPVREVWVSRKLTLSVGSDDAGTGNSLEDGGAEWEMKPWSEVSRSM